MSRTLARSQVKGLVYLLVLEVISATSGVYTEKLLKTLQYCIDFQNILLYTWGVRYVTLRYVTLCSSQPKGQPLPPDWHACLPWAMAEIDAAWLAPGCRSCGPHMQEIFIYLFTDCCVCEHVSLRLPYVSIHWIVRSYHDPALDLPAGVILWHGPSGWLNVVWHNR
jgi:hypothetical protein